MSEGGRIEPGPSPRRKVMSQEDRLVLIHSLIRAEQDGVQIEGCLGPFSLFELICALQLAWRHPYIRGKQRARMELLGRNLSDAFDDPVREVLEEGWVR